MRHASLAVLPGLTTYSRFFVRYTGFLSNLAFSTNILTFKSVKNQAPSYLSKLIELHVPSRQLRSSADTQLLVFHLLTPSLLVDAPSSVSHSYSGTIHPTPSDILLP